MKKYLTEVIEWGAHRLLALVVNRAVEIIEETDRSFDDMPKQLPPPKLPQIELAG